MVYPRAGGGLHFERRHAINTFINTLIFGKMLPACAKEYLTAAKYYCEVEVKVRDQITAVDAIFPPVFCSDIISKQYRFADVKPNIVDRIYYICSNCDISFAKMS